MQCALVWRQSNLQGKGTEKELEEMERKRIGTDADELDWTAVKVNGRKVGGVGWWWWWGVQHFKRARSKRSSLQPRLQQTVGGSPCR